MDVARLLRAGMRRDRAAAARTPVSGVVCSLVGAFQEPKAVYSRVSRPLSYRDARKSGNEGRTGIVRGVAFTV